jgi:nucleoside-diphosphate-sugar epimerase
MTEATEPFAGRRILLAGLGDLGSGLAEQLMAAGARVTGVRRGPRAPRGVDLERMDLADRAALARLPDDFDAAVLCVTPASHDEAGYRAGYLEVAEAFAARFAGASLRAVLWVGSTAVYGPSSPDAAPVSDDAPTEPEGFRGRILLAAEAALRDAGLPVTAVRLSGIYGPGREALLRRVLAGRGAPSAPVHWTNRIHRDDAVGVLEFLLRRALLGEALPEAVLATDPNPSPRHEILEWLAARLGVRLAAGEAERADRAPSRRLYPERLLGLGYRFRHADFRSGFEALVADLESTGELAASRKLSDA